MLHAATTPTPKNLSVPELAVSPSGILEISPEQVGERPCDVRVIDASGVKFSGDGFEAFGPPSMSDAHGLGRSTHR